MRYPAFLQPGGTIGFVAPSFGCAIEPYRTAFENAQKKFAALGYQLVLGPNCYAQQGVGISNTPEKCGQELNRFLCGDQADIVISCGGGELMCETLDHVDFDAIRQAPPKWFMGYSDNTNLTFLLATLCDTAAVYGPCAASFGMEPWHPALQDAMDLLTGKKQRVQGYDRWEKEGLKDEEHPLAPYHVTEPRVLRRFPDQDAAFSGRLIGGCMDCLVNLTGTRYDRVADFCQQYQQDGIIWFLEACDLNVFAMRRAIWQMQQAGWFAHVKGFLIGRPALYDQPAMGLDQYHAVYDLLARYQVPVIQDVDLGHLPPMMPLICGSYAQVECKGNDISITMLCR